MARSPEPDWYEAMERPLHELGSLAEDHVCPILYAGDIFDRWNVSPEVINFALEHLPPGYAIPGQHDLPHHNYGDIERSAYWTLVAAGHLEHLHHGTPRSIGGGLRVWAYPWGYPPYPCTPSGAGELNIALIHKFIWSKGTGYPGAASSDTVSASIKSLAGFDVAAYGDNHKGFLIPPRNEGQPWIINCGGFMRRKVDERDAKPGVGLLHADGTVTRHYLDISAEAFIEQTAAEEAVEKLLDMTGFVDGLQRLGANDALDFIAAVNTFFDNNQIEDRVRTIILEATGQ